MQTGEACQQPNNVLQVDDAMLPGSDYSVIEFSSSAATLTPSIP